MNSLAYDFHMHSCLSPCGDNDMTPNNIAGMASIKKLDAIALTDHNTCRNCEATAKVAKKYGICFIPGMELTTNEEIHVVCLFKKLDKALEWDSYVYSKLIKVKNNENIFGSQNILDENDEIKGTEENLLINATTINFEDVFPLIDKYDGIAIPAHIDKSSNSLLSQFGFIPDNSNFRCVEIHDMTKYRDIVKDNPYILNCRIISDSDAHYLEDINERINFIHPEENTPECIINYLKTR